MSKQIKVPQFCPKHHSLLVHQANYKKTDAWQAMTVVANLVIFQAVTADPKTQEKIKDDITKIENFGCLACYKPDAFGEIVEAAKTHDLSKIKAVGEKYLSAAGMKMESGPILDEQ